MLNSEPQELVTGDGGTVPGEIILLIFNAHADSITFVMPMLPREGAWTCVLDTAVGEGAPREPIGPERRVDGRSVVACIFVNSHTDSGSAS